MPSKALGNSSTQFVPVKPAIKTVLIVYKIIPQVIGWWIISYSVIKAQQLMSGGQQLRSKLWAYVTGKVSGHYKTENLSGNKSFSAGQG